MLKKLFKNLFFVLTAFLLIGAFFVFSLLFENRNEVPKKTDYIELHNFMYNEVTNMLKIEESFFKGKIKLIPKQTHRGWAAFVKIDIDSSDLDEKVSLENIFIIKNPKSYKINFTYNYLYYEKKNAIFKNDIIIKYKDSFYYHIYKPNGTLKIKIPLNPATEYLWYKNKLVINSGNNTEKIAEIELNNGKRNGISKYYYPNYNDCLFELIDFKNGIKKGKSKTYLLDGKFYKYF